MSAKDRNALLGPSLGPALAKMDYEEFAKSLIDKKTFQPLSITDMKSKSNELARILKEQAKT